MATVAEAAGKGSASKALALSKVSPTAVILSQLLESDSPSSSQAGGAFLFVSASSGFYLVVVQLFESVDMPFTLPVGDMSGLWPKKKTD